MFSQRSVAAALPLYIPSAPSCRPALSLSRQTVLGFHTTNRYRKNLFRYIDPGSSQNKDPRAGKPDQNKKSQDDGVDGTITEDSRRVKTSRTSHIKRKSSHQHSSLPNQSSKTTKSTPSRNKSPESTLPKLESHGERGPYGTSRAYTVLTATPQTTTLGHLLEQLPVLDWISSRSRVAVFTLLVTPSYAASIRYDTNLIEETAKRLYSGTRIANSSLFYGFHTLLAVVDRLPRPIADIKPTSPSDDLGSEGIALVVLSSSVDVPDLHLDTNILRESKQHDVATSSQVAQSITFNITSRKTRSEKSRHLGAKHHSLSYSLQVPLANTIFQNGLPSTLIHTRYEQKKGEPVLDLTKNYSRHLKQQVIGLPFHLVEQDKPNVSLNAPLVPLTEARRVVACMGNIIRRLSAGKLVSDENDTILASQELETSVSAFFTARGIPPQTVSVWALVVPKHIFTKSMSDVLYPRDLTSRWSASSQSWIESGSFLTPLSLLERGARLHKVLSGGGGWGKKAGLLSLDPDSSYANAGMSIEEPSFFSDLDLEAGKQESALRDIISPGDMIQFYIATNAAMTNEPQQKAAENPERGNDEQSVVFGTIPSTIDTMPSAGTGANPSRPDIELIANHFGALSENGIALTINSHSESDSTETESVNQTKIDVPFSRFNLWSSGLDTQIDKPEQMSADMEGLFQRFEDIIDGEEARKQGLNLSPTKPLQAKFPLGPTQRT